MQLHDAQLVPGLADHSSNSEGWVLLPSSDAASGASAGPADLCKVLDAAEAALLG